MKRSALFFFFIGIGFFLFGQEKVEKTSSLIADQIIVELDGKTSIEKVLSDLNRNDFDLSFSLKREIDKDFSFYLLSLDRKIFEESDQVLYHIRSKKGVIDAGFNYISEYRSVPNDSLFNNQWDMTKIQATEVWSTTTGGRTACGDQIVVAIGEPTAGFNLKHADIAANIYVNNAEIAGNNKDDDGNGYIDDVNGINAETGKGDISGDPMNHGTAVLGIIGAVGNNNRGVSGVNWNVKMLVVSNMSSEADIIAGYAYMIKMRKLYNESKGKKGAFIVVSSYSGGINQVFEAQAKSWCGMYDKLGEVGILSVGAGPNLNLDVDMKGDIPTTCSSNYFIGVTNTSRTDAKVKDAGFGAISIDLGAPGGIPTPPGGGNTQASFTTKTNSKNGSVYGEFTGTSAATPHVSGAIALLYSIADSSLCKKAKTDPAGAALFMKKTILDNVDKLSSLNGTTVTGGRLNVFKSFQALENAAKPVQVEFLEVRPTLVTTIFQLHICTLSSMSQDFYIYNEIGQLVQKNKFTPKVIDSNFIIDVANLPNGFYTITSITEDKKLDSKKFVIQR
jgi:serine protease